MTGANQHTDEGRLGIMGDRITISPELANIYANVWNPKHNFQVPSYLGVKQ